MAWQTAIIRRDRSRLPVLEAAIGREALDAESRERLAVQEGVVPGWGLARPYGELRPPWPSDAPVAALCTP